MTTTSEKVMLSYHGDPAIKEKYIARMKAHIAADELVQGATGDGGKGCAVWCTLNKYEHEPYESELGIPRILARLEDRIFEGLSVQESRDFPLNFLKAVPVGKDLSNVCKHFFVWMLTDPTDGVIKFAKTNQTREAIQGVSDLLAKSLLENVTADEFRIVRDVARNAAAAASYAADTAASYAAAAYAAASYAADASYAASYAADTADTAYAADTAASYAADTASYARKNYYSKMAAKLIELLQAT